MRSRVEPRPGVDRRGYRCADQWWLTAGVLIAVLLTSCGGTTTANQRPSPPGAATSTTPNRGPAATAPGASVPCGTAATASTAYDHVIWIWMENHTASDVIGNADAPYETSLAGQCGTAAHYSSVGSPSLPNYIGATSGDTQAISDDDPPPNHRIVANNLFRQVRDAAKTEKSYEESMVATCDLGSAGNYAVKHNPAAYYVGAGDRAACQSDDIPSGSTTTGALRHDLDAGTLPAFTFITPNLCSDTHDCPVSTGDQWLHQWVPSILSSPTYRLGRTAVFVVWDEPTPMPLIVISPSTRPGTVATKSFDHYALLRTTEELLGLQPLLGHAATAPSMRTAFNL